MLFISMLCFASHAKHVSRHTKDKSQVLTCVETHKFTCRSRHAIPAAETTTCCAKPFKGGKVLAQWEHLVCRPKVCRAYNLCRALQTQPWSSHAACHRCVSQKDQKVLAASRKNQACLSPWTHGVSLRVWRCGCYHLGLWQLHEPESVFWFF